MTMNVACIVLASGNSTRFENTKSKLFYNVYGAPILEFTLKNIVKYISKNSVYITISKKITKNEKNLISDYTSNSLIYGGKTRFESLKLGLSAIDKTKYKYVMIHDGARPVIPHKMMQELLKSIKSGKYDTSVPYLDIEDTLRNKLNTLRRENYQTFQTPQIFKIELLFSNIKNKNTFCTDDLGIIEKKSSLKVKLVKSSKENIKITKKEDVELFKKILTSKLKFGNGFDIHKLKLGSTLSLGGIKIKSKYTAVGHSDGDVVLHSIIDALLGALNKGDIGKYFPAIPKYKNISSVLLFEEIMEIIRFNNIIIDNLDCTIICQKIRLEKYKKEIEKNISKLLRCNLNNINVKAKTADNVGTIGRSKAIACWTTLKLINL